MYVWQASKEKNRFEKLMEYFMNDDSNIDFMVSLGIYSTESLNDKCLANCTCSVNMLWVLSAIFGSVQVACMQFINIVVHSVENMNFRVHLQYEFTHLGLDKYLEVSYTKSNACVQYTV